MCNHQSPCVCQNSQSHTSAEINSIDALQKQYVSYDGAVIERRSSNGSFENSSPKPNWRDSGYSEGYFGNLDESIQTDESAPSSKVEDFSSLLQKLKGSRHKLNLIVEELSDATAVDYQTALVAFINCLIISTPRLADRTRLRNEFIGE